MMFFAVMMKLDKRGLADEFGDIVMNFHWDNAYTIRQPCLRDCFLKRLTLHLPDAISREFFRKHPTL